MSTLGEFLFAECMLKILSVKQICTLWQFTLHSKGRWLNHLSQRLNVSNAKLFQKLPSKYSPGKEKQSYVK